MTQISTAAIAVDNNPVVLTDIERHVANALFCLVIAEGDACQAAHYQGALSLVHSWDPEEQQRFDAFIAEAWRIKNLIDDRVISLTRNDRARWVRGKGESGKATA